VGRRCCCEKGLVGVGEVLGRAEEEGEKLIKSCRPGVPSASNDLILLGEQERKFFATLSSNKIR